MNESPWKMFLCILNFASVYPPVPNSTLQVSITNVMKFTTFIIIYSIRDFHISVSWWFFHWSSSDSKSPQVSMTRLRIVAVLCNAVVWKVSTRPPTSKSSRPFNNPLVTVPNAPITIGTIVTFMFHSFFNSLIIIIIIIIIITQNIRNNKI